jgi:hypothetical protein
MAIIVTISPDGPTFFMNLPRKGLQKEEDPERMVPSVSSMNP